MELVDNVILGFGMALSPTNLFYCFIGVFLGTMLGALPGIGSLAAVSMLLPLSIGLPPTTALVMLAGVYYGSEYGGSTSSILLNLPGTPTNAVTCIDGYPMAQQGRAGVALFSTTIASFVGGSFGIIALYTLSPLLADAAIAIGPAEYFSLMVAGLVAAAVVTDERPLKGIAMVALGLMFGTIGTDVDSGVARYNLGYLELRDGISFIALAMGLFGVSEVIMSLRSSMSGRRKIDKVTFRSMLPEREEWRQSAGPVARGALLGGVFGALPGTGATIATFLSYAIEKKIARDPSRFGNGAIEGIVSPESANNSAAQTAFIPTLTLGIPGSATMAIMLGALIMNGVAPGPQLMMNNPEIFWGLAASFWIGNVLLLVLNIPLIGLWIRLLQIPYTLLYPAILILICIGTYTVRNSAFDIMLVLLFGLLGYVLRTLKFQLAPILIGFILGPMIEENFKRAMLFSRGDFMTFLERPISGITLSLTAALLLWAVFKTLAGRRRAARAIGQ
ncbi:tripartite tricarboxylate transporter permease [Alkalilacustris brevis]|uniref:tripartite tricarboxylate transporter permease n=1 Tax=Alkalilacustris brevis TaxID=2026338 RepID=UPI000E0CCDD8|nr:tripartite tricarboxylate transporter permease [Alkalilacustris brevis]